MSVASRLHLHIPRFLLLSIYVFQVLGGSSRIYEFTVPSATVLQSYILIALISLRAGSRHFVDAHILRCFLPLLGTAHLIGQVGLVTLVCVCVRNFSGAGASE